MKRLALLAFAALVLACGGSGTPSLERWSKAMPVPPLATPTAGAGGAAHYDLVAQAGETAFFPGKPSPTYGYNGALLGPTLRLRRGQPVEVTLTNHLPESDDDHTNLHWHGLKVAGDVDIAPSGAHGLHPGASMTVAFTPDQPAATLWYHPHPHGHVGLQVNLGLAAFLILEDEVSDGLAIPKSYGVDDFPLVFQDRTFRPDGSPAYMETMGDKDFMMGNEILVNGAVAPHLDLPAGTVRLRLLNGSSTRRYRFALDDRHTFHQIASDGGFLEAPLALTSLDLAPAERAEILVDFSGDQGKTLFLRSLAFESAEEERSSGQGRPFPLVQLRISQGGTRKPLPPALTGVPRIPETEATRTRSFGLEDTGDGVINGKAFDMDRVDETVPAGATEIWSVKNFSEPIAHPFHIHGGQFQILDRDGVTPGPSERGWKDTFLVNPLETVRVILRFRDLKGRYMYHCHILEHEDAGMMGQFEVLE